MKLSGKAHKFGDDINTDLIISGKYKFKSLDIKDMSTHLMEDVDPKFHSRITKGDYIVAGRNFGCGSSREQAPLVIKAAGVSAVIAKSFARIFFRNAINVGLPLIECKDADKIDAGDVLEADLDKGVVFNKTKNVKLDVKPLPGVMIKILQDGGLAEHFKKYGGFKLEAQ
ncbi:MAG: 3-isopropylmalate dehydratase small subunit [Candidatus Altiarchaeia archaeon]